MNGSIGVSYSTNVYEWVGTLIAGFILGVILLVYSQRKGLKKAGFIGFGSCLASSFILGLYLQIPLFLIFLILIKHAAKKQINN